MKSGKVEWKKLTFQQNKAVRGEILEIFEVYGCDRSLVVNRGGGDHAVCF